MPDTKVETPLIRHYVAGGTEHGGGIGRLVGYVLAGQGARFRHVVVDTRGPRLSPVQSPLRLLSAMAVMAADSLRGRAVLHQFHLAGRGSTARKLVLAAWAGLLGVPYVLHLHDYDYASDLARRPRWQFRAIRAMFRRAEQVIVLGQRDVGTVQVALDVPTSRITLLRNCVPDPGPKPASRREHVSLLFLGRLGPRKGVPELLAALAGPAMPRSGWSATLAGDGEVDRYRREVAQRGLSGQVRVTGWVDADRSAQLRAGADILVLPSHAEGFAMAVLEGLAQGLAVVTTRVGGHGEVLADGRDCLLVPPGDVTALSDALARLIRDPALRRRLGAAGRELFLSRFGIDDYIRKLESIQSAHGLAGAVETRSA